MEKTQELLKNFKISDTLIAHVIKSKKVVNKVNAVFQESKLTQGDNDIGTALVTLAEKLDEAFFHRLPFIVQYIVDRKLLNPHQIESVVDYIKSKGSDMVIEKDDFESKVGIGIEIKDSDIKASVDKHVKIVERNLLIERYKFKYVNLLYEIKKDFAYLDNKLAKEILIKTIEQILGPKSEEELKEDSLRAELEKLKEKKKAIRDAAKKNKKAKEGKETNEVAWTDDEEKRLEELKNLIKHYDEEFERRVKEAHLDVIGASESEKDKLSKIIGRDMSSALNSEILMKKHLDFTKGKVFTRFPPEPNGYLHIGHAKAMRFSFTSASKKDGNTYLRFDDTNPEKETKEFIDNIVENVNWLGYTPFKITHASDYFEELYDLAIELIKRGKAYVCFLSKDEVAKDREELKESPYRNTSVEKNLDLFRKMRQGRFSEKECCLRMKIDMKHKNPVMRDPVAYRIKYAPHPHAGDKWCIYPTYDYTHCLNDSLENITHSLCTLEFEIRRDGYYWLLEALDLYRPFVWEYSRMNISHFLLSKRRLTKMVDEKIVRGWDDPRMPTINGLRRRGYTSEAINHFVDTVGVTRRGNENFVSYKLLENSIKLDLDKKATRAMAVVDPIEVVLTNLPNDYSQEIKTSLFPKNKELGDRAITLSKKIYIERSDFKEAAGEDFFGLTLGQEVGLKYSGIIKVNKINKNESGEVIGLECEFSNEDRKTKGRIHWISDADKVRAEIRWYDLFFLSENPNSLSDWEKDINPKSEIIYRGAWVNKNLANSGLKALDHFQFERLGYFVVDYDTKATNNNFVFNLTVKL
eukprot:CAMPEP_0170525050 /NCGR_PEP_ID=MMETSP0209-20121228/10508_1 /TAXON_ID=665100 ORGANISM="Litonotus pictus, Strain P1" /NCGR_SAMPLE_ID=MMETSP0209 /ASSEMBLY_ACC=CAM_ASM_000301 /LENGTH=806 /DNA_ID=CAMNT_0010814091 /DNA_START=113 /DNA_END=2533 /DNA_ORIENTATION=+